MVWSAGARDHVSGREPSLLVGKVSSNRTERSDTRGGI